MQVVAVKVTEQGTQSVVATVTPDEITPWRKVLAAGGFFGKTTGHLRTGGQVWMVTKFDIVDPENGLPVMRFEVSGPPVRMGMVLRRYDEPLTPEEVETFCDQIAMVVRLSIATHSVAMAKLLEPLALPTEGKGAARAVAFWRAASAMAELWPRSVELDPSLVADGSAMARELLK